MYHILLLILLGLGLTAIPQEEQPTSRNLIENAAGEVVAFTHVTCILQAAADDLPAHPCFTDESTHCWISDAVHSCTPCTHNSSSSKSQKIKNHLPAGQLKHLWPNRLSLEHSTALFFTPNSIRYLSGYYIYALQQILI